jgi:hypothetical protein
MIGEEDCVSVRSDMDDALESSISASNVTSEDDAKAPENAKGQHCNLFSFRFVARDNLLLLLHVTRPKCGGSVQYRQHFSAACRRACGREQAAAAPQMLCAAAHVGRLAPRVLRSRWDRFVYLRASCEEGTVDF